MPSDSNFMQVNAGNAELVLAVNNFSSAALGPSDTQYWEAEYYLNKSGELIVYENEYRNGVRKIFKSKSSINDLECTYNSSNVNVVDYDYDFLIRHGIIEEDNEKAN